MPVDHQMRPSGGTLQQLLWGTLVMVAGSVVCAAAASLEWMQMRHRRYAPRQYASTDSVSLSHASPPYCLSAYLFRGPEGTPPSCTFL